MQRVGRTCRDEVFPEDKEADNCAKEQVKSLVKENEELERKFKELKDSLIRQGLLESKTEKRSYKNDTQV